MSSSEQPDSESEAVEDAASNEPEPTASSDPVQVTTEEPVADSSPVPPVDDAGVEVAELDAIASELDDVELVLQHLEGRPEVLDASCETAAEEGSLNERSALLAYREARTAAENR